MQPSCNWLDTSQKMPSRSSLDEPHHSTVYRQLYRDAQVPMLCYGEVLGPV